MPTQLVALSLAFLLVVAQAELSLEVQANSSDSTSKGFDLLMQ